MRDAPQAAFIPPAGQCCAIPHRTVAYIAALLSAIMTVAIAAPAKRE